MKQLLSPRLIALGIALAAIGATLIVTTARATQSSTSRAGGNWTVGLGKTAIGTILVNSRGRTLYLFEKDRNGVSMCDTACLKYWPALTSHGTLRAGKGVHQSLLRLAQKDGGVRQVTYAGHPLYTFVGDKRPGQTTGEGLNNFGAGWDAVAANGHKVEQNNTTGGSGGGY